MQVGGCLGSCLAHINAAKEHQALQGADIDFKLSTSQGPVNAACERESGFDKLVVRQVAELVTLGPRAQGCASVGNTAHHLTPQEFHDQLQRADGSNTVLLDARNIYESRIGCFSQVHLL